MIVNSLKSKVTIFGKKEDNLNFIYNNEVVEIVECYKYLGVLFNRVKDTRGNIFKDMSQYIADKALKSCFACIRKCSKIGSVTPNIFFKLFDSYVRPILEYSCEIWTTGSYKDMLERIQLRYIKMILGVKVSSSTAALFCETGRYPLYIRHVTRIIKYWARLTRLTDDNLAKRMYMLLRNLTDLGFQTWVSRVKELLYEHNLGEFYEANFMSAQEVNTNLNNLESALKEKFSNKCLQELYHLTSLRTYVTFKNNYVMEDYLKVVTDYKLRKYISKFRLSSHPLPIERGRYTQPITAKENRICHLCNLRAIGDELHFLLICPYFDVQRASLVGKIDRFNPSVLNTHSDAKQVFVNIMMNKDSRIIIALAKFIQVCFKKL